MVSIIGIPKAMVLAALFNRAKAQGLGILHHVDRFMEQSEAALILSETHQVDYLEGRVLKVNLSSDEAFDERLYDRDNGPGAAAHAVADARYWLIKRDPTVTNVARALLNLFPEVKWDRCTPGKAFGWIERPDGRSDFMLLEWHAYGFTTSSAEYSRAFSERLFGPTDGHNDCSRVEDVFPGDLVKNKVTRGAVSLRKRSLVETIEEILPACRHIPELASGLGAVCASATFAAPETMPKLWREASKLLETYVPLLPPIGPGSSEDVRRIWMGEESKQGGAGSEPRTVRGITDDLTPGTHHVSEIPVSEDPSTVGRSAGGEEPAKGKEV